MTYNNMSLPTLDFHTGRHQMYRNKLIRKNIFLELWRNKCLSLNNVS